jgi:hypothetical protein
MAKSLWKPKKNSDPPAAHLCDRKERANRAPRAEARIVMVTSLPTR